MPLPAGTRVVVHSKDDCPYCEIARDWLNTNSVAFEEVKHNDQADRQALYDSLGLEGRDRTVPQIVVVDDEMQHSYRVGGASALATSGLA